MNFDSCFTTIGGWFHQSDVCFSSLAQLISELSELRSVQSCEASVPKVGSITFWLWLTVRHGIDGPFIDGLPIKMI